MIEKNNYDNLVTELILLDMEYNIKEVRDLESIKSRLFDRDQYRTILELIKQQDWKQINELQEPSVEAFNEYLNIMRFKNQNQSQYVVTIYDNDELFQDPQIIDIFPITDNDS